MPPLTTDVLDAIEDEEDASTVIHMLEDSDRYTPDREHEGRFYDTLYSLDIENTGEWKYDHRFRPHSVVYDPEEDDFDVKRPSATDVVKAGAGTLLDRGRELVAGLRDDEAREEYGYVLDREAAGEYEELLREEGFEPDHSLGQDGHVHYLDDEAATVVIEQDGVEERGRTYLDVEVRISDGRPIPGGEFLLEKQRKVSFEGELEAEAVYPNTPPGYEIDEQAETEQ
ncbi:MAG: hypothetical protein SV186_02105 [Candidatus Nanohaloarchaea archaeon]|nr:hypothetical protein [Candidatus Nanohaloarchaea archaeon]